MKVIKNRIDSAKAALEGKIGTELEKIGGRNAWLTVCRAMRLNASSSASGSAAVPMSGAAMDM